MAPRPSPAGEKDGTCALPSRQLAELGSRPSGLRSGGVGGRAAPAPPTRAAGEEQSADGGGDAPVLSSSFNSSFIPRARHRQKLAKCVMG